MTVFNLTKESIKSQEDDIRHRLSGFMREFPGTYVSMMSANFYLRITDPNNFDAILRFYQQDYPALTDIVQDNVERGKLGFNYPMENTERAVLYEALGRAGDQPYEMVKTYFQKLEHLLQIGC